MYLRKIRPRTRCLSILLRTLSAASQGVASKPRLAAELVVEADRRDMNKPPFYPMNRGEATTAQPTELTNAILAVLSVPFAGPFRHRIAALVAASCWRQNGHE